MHASALKHRLMLTLVGRVVLFTQRLVNTLLFTPSLTRNIYSKVSKLEISLLDGGEMAGGHLIGVTYCKYP